MGFFASARRTAALVGTLMCLVPLSPAAAELEWFQEALVVAEPNELGYYSHVAESCPATADDVSTIIEGVMIRSRIRPQAESYSDDEQLFIEINVYCSNLPTDDGVIFETDVRFGFLARNTDMVLNWDYGTLDYGSAGDIEAVVRRDVEDAITDYIRANLPIAPSEGTENTFDSSSEETRL